MLAVYILSTFVLSFSTTSCLFSKSISSLGTFLSNFARHSSFLLISLLSTFPPITLQSYPIVWAQLGSIALGALVAVITGLDVAPFSRHISFSRIKELVQYGKYIVGTYFSTSMIRTVDQVMLKA